MYYGIYDDDIVASFLQYWNVIVDFRPMTLGYALSDPYYIPAFLLLEFQVRVKDAEVELSEECIDVQLDLLFEMRLILRYSIKF